MKKIFSIIAISLCLFNFSSTKTIHKTDDGKVILICGINNKVEEDDDVLDPKPLSDKGTHQQLI